MISQIVRTNREMPGLDGLAEPYEPAPYLSIVVPVLNEEPNLAPLYDQLTTALEAIGRPYEVIVIDDGSTDGSFEILRRLHEQDPRWVILRQRRNFGQTAAFQAGFDYARGEVVITIDADLQNDPADIQKLLDKMAEGYDIVSGWRYKRKDGFLFRRLPSMVANRLISRATTVQLHDYGCSLKAYHRDIAKNVRLYGELHRFIPALASPMGVRIAELPVNHRPRERGQSKYGIGRTLRVTLDLITVYFLLSYSARPMQLFGSIGLVSGAFGSLMLLYLFGLKLVNGWDYRIYDRPLLLLGVMLAIIAVQFLMMGLLGELMVRTYHECQDKPIYYIREVLGRKKRASAERS